MTVVSAIVPVVGNMFFWWSLNCCDPAFMTTKTHPCFYISSGMVTFVDLEAEY